MYFQKLRSVNRGQTSKPGTKKKLLISNLLRFVGSGGPDQSSSAINGAMVAIGTCLALRCFYQKDFKTPPTLIPS